MNEARAPLPAAIGPAANAAAVVGFVEATTGEKLFGWAWSPSAPTVRLAIEVVLDGATVARSVADQPREDLSRNGVGDGRHAFVVDVPEALRPRAADLRVVARAGDDAPVALGAPPAAEPVAERLDRLQRGLDAVIGSQRVLHRTMQAALVDERRPAASDAETGPARDELRAQIATLEVFVARLDERLAALAPAAAASPRTAGPWALLAAGAAVLLSAAALLHAVPG